MDIMKGFLVFIFVIATYFVWRTPDNNPDINCESVADVSMLLVHNRFGEMQHDVADIYYADLINKFGETNAWLAVATWKDLHVTDEQLAELPQKYWIDACLLAKKK